MRFPEEGRAVALTRVAVALAAVTLLVGSGGTSVTAAPAVQDGCPGNLLVNPSFDGGSHKTESEGTSLSSAVSDGWSPWFVRGSESENREPEFKVEQVAIGGDPARVRSGGQSMKWFTTWATHSAGIYQKVAVAPGTRVQFDGYGMIYTGEGDIFDGERKTFVSDPQRSGNYRIWVGIDPTGALPAGMGSPPPASVVWSPASMTTDDWVPLSVSAIAQGPSVTVYLKGQPEWGVKHNDSFWEDTCLTTGGRGPVTAPEGAAPGEPAAVAGTPAEEASYPAPTSTEASGEATEAEDETGRGGGPDATALPARGGGSIETPAWSRPAVAGQGWAIPL